MTSIKTFRQEFEKKGHEVIIFCPKTAESDLTEENVFHFPSVSYPFQKEYRFSLPYSGILKQFETMNIDLIHAQTPFSMGYLGRHLAKKHGIPMVHTYHTLFVEYLHYFPLIPDKWARKLYMKESRRFCNGFSALLVPSQPIKDHLIEHNVNGPIHILPTGVLETSVTDVDEFKDRYKIKDKKVALFIGRLAKEKNVYFLLEAFNKMQAKHSDLILLVVGDGPEREFMSDRVARYGIEDKVIFTGYLSRDDVFRAIQSSHLLTFPSKTETQGLSVLESLSQGLPALCIDAMGVQMVLENHRGGMLCKDSIDDYCEAWDRFISDQTFYQKKSEEAKQRAADFSSDRLSNQILDIYQSIL